MLIERMSGFTWRSSLLRTVLHAPTDRSLQVRTKGLLLRSFSASISLQLNDATPQAEAYFHTSEEVDGVGIITLNRPQAKNALSVTLLDQVRAALNAIRFDPSTRVLILNSSRPDIFCAGADLKERKSMSRMDVSKFLYTLRSLLRELSQLNVPTIAALDGPALGGGLEVALCCDLRVAASSVKSLGLPETRLAIIPGAGGTQRLSRLIGVSRAKELIFTGQPVTAIQAEKIGLVNYLAEPGQSATDKSIEVSKEILKGGPLAIRAAKLAIDSGSQMDLESALDFEHTCYQTIMPSLDRLEGLKAYVSFSSNNPGDSPINKPILTKLCLNDGGFKNSFRFSEKRKPIYRGE